MANPMFVKHQTAKFELQLVVGFVIVILVFGLLWSYNPIFQQHELVGFEAPDIEIELRSDRKTSLRKQKGNVVLLSFWASWCAPCMEEMPSLRMLDLYLCERGFVLFALNVDEKERDVRGKLSGMMYPENLIFNFSKKSLQHYRINTLPISILIDKYGIVQTVFHGPRNWMDKKVIAEIELYLR